MKLALLLLACAAAVAVAEKRYEGYQVLRIYPENDKQLEYLAEMRARSNLDFWTDHIRRDHVDVMVSPLQGHILKAQLYLNGMRSEVFIPDVQELIDLTTPARAQGERLDLETYNRLANIHGWLDELAAANPSWVSTEIIGQSTQGRDLKVIRLNSANSPHKFWIDGGIHAREWISPATVLYILDQLVNNYEANKELVDSYEWVILPVHNPDGYEYTFTDVSMSLWLCIQNEKHNSQLRERIIPQLSQTAFPVPITENPLRIQ